MKFLKILSVFLGMAAFGGCATMDLGKGGSMVSGASGNAGSQGEAKQLAKCPVPIATVEVDEPSSEPVNAAGMTYLMAAQYYGVPQDPRPLIKLMLAQTNCFKVVDRAAGLRAAKREHELAAAGLTRKDNPLKKGNVVEAQYTIVSHLIFSEDNAGGGAIFGAIANMFFPGAGGLVAAGMRFKEAQVMLTLINNETLVQEGVAEGSAKSTDIGFGGGVLGGIGGAVGGGWNNTNSGKVVAAALMDATNKIVSMVRNLNVPLAPKPIIPK